jgi:hypothetical protein
MRCGPDDKFWVVVNPTADSELGDVLFETSLRGLELQFRGGLTMAENPTMFSEKEEAIREAQGRLASRRARDNNGESANENP